MRKFFEVIYRFFRGVIRFSFLLFLATSIPLIKFVSGEKDKRGEITPRKARRIRFFTKIKIFMGQHCLWLAEFLNGKDYIIDVNKRLGYGV